MFRFFGKSKRRSLETEMAGLLFKNPVGVPYVIEKQRFGLLRQASSAGFLMLNAPQDHVLPWIKELQEIRSRQMLLINVGCDIVRNFSLVYDFADLIVIDPDSDGGIGAADISDIRSLIDEIVSLRLCYDHYTPVFLRLRHGLTNDELHTLLSVCRLSGLDGVVVPTARMASDVKSITDGRFPIIGKARSAEDAIEQMHAGASLLEVNLRLSEVNHLLKTLEKQPSL